MRVHQLRRGFCSSTGYDITILKTGANVLIGLLLLREELGVWPRYGSS
jgi:hypothetical protein